MEIFVLPQFMFNELLQKLNITEENVEEDKEKVFISIIGTGKEEKSYFKENKSNVLLLKFDDIDDDVIVDGEIIGHCFDKEDAKKVINFLDTNKEKKHYIIHCAAGVSRSGAIGTFINDYLEGDYFKFKLGNPHILPNGKVLSVLNRFMRENGE